MPNKLLKLTCICIFNLQVRSQVANKHLAEMVGTLMGNYFGNICVATLGSNLLWNSERCQTWGHARNRTND